MTPEEYNAVVVHPIHKKHSNKWRIFYILFTAGLIDRDKAREIKTRIIKDYNLEWEEWKYQDIRAKSAQSDQRPSLPYCAPPLLLSTT